MIAPTPTAAPWDAEPEFDTQCDVCGRDIASSEAHTYHRDGCLNANGTSWCHCEGLVCEDCCPQCNDHAV